MLLGPYFPRLYLGAGSRNNRVIANKDGILARECFSSNVAELDSFLV